MLRVRIYSFKLIAQLFLFREVKEVAAIAKGKENIIDFLPDPLSIFLFIVGLLQISDFVFEASENDQVLSEYY